MIRCRVRSAVKANGVRYEPGAVVYFSEADVAALQAQSSATLSPLAIDIDSNVDVVTGAEAIEAALKDTVEPLKAGGPTIEEYVAAGYHPATYPPSGYADVASPGLDVFRTTSLMPGEPAPVDLAPPHEAGQSGCPKCDGGWICEAHPDRAWPHDECPGPGMLCTACQPQALVEPQPEATPAKSKSRGKK